MEQSEIKRIIEQIERLHNTNWAGIALNQILDEVDDTIANTRLSFFNNTIHQIARHVLATEFVVIKRLQGIDFELTKEEDWIPSDKLRNIKWSDTKNALKKSKDDLIITLQKVFDSDLDNPVIKDYSTVYVTVHGHLQHSYYHFGQISLMKKAIENSNQK